MLARAYVAAPIGITVEGANILTRSMIIYGQGAIRCHPFAREEMSAVAEKNLARFDKAFFGHFGFIATSACRAFLLGLTNGALARPALASPLGRILGQLSRMSAAFVLVSDAAMATLGGRLKRREKISGRLADALAWLYLGSAAAKRFWDDGRREADRPFVEWSCRFAQRRIQEALLGILDNFPNRLVALALRPLLFPFGASRRPPSDALGARVARTMLEDREGRLHLTSDMYVPPADEPGLGRLEAAHDKAVLGLAVEAKIRDAVREGRIDKAPGNALVELALRARVITEAEREQLNDADEARDEAIQVDAFDPEAYRALVR
jgi:acyl-CoA dehydrogenase